MNSELLSIINTALNEKGPASVGALPDRGSNLMEIRNMNATTNTTAPAENPAPRKLTSKLNDLNDAAHRAQNLVIILDLAVGSLIDTRASNALAETCDVLLTRMDEIFDLIQSVREQAA